ncbi:unnamed protein product [Clonostachys chloroleuca]|uniref:DUF6546 domain-containing protein n=1 Tax=Clonostachys chloroleuca TaxID=1926264 RepID=A0AA35QFZ2_9HYPO|nr:unnamed protein product [Clonostachys chloroleuca]
MRHQFKRQLSPLALAKLLGESLGFHYVAETFRGGRLVDPVQVNSLSTAELLNDYDHQWKELSVVEPFGSLDQFTESQGLKALGTELLSPNPWLQLQRVCFKSTVLIPGNEVIISDLLVSTAVIARNMPNIRSIEIFNTNTKWYEESPSCLVRYNTEFPQPILSWQSDWMFSLEAIVKAFQGTPDQRPGFSFTAHTRRAWERTALVHTGRDELRFVVREPRKSFPISVQLADKFKLDAVHPLTRAIMRVYSDRMKLW